MPGSLSGEGVHLPYVVDLLVCQPAVVLEHVVVLAALRLRDALRDGQDLEQVVVGDVCELRAVDFRDDELCTSA